MKSITDKFNKYAIRDPIHGFIWLSQKEMDVVNSQIFQRLRRIKQLAMAHLVYPGALHTRFEHSLGTLYIAGKMAEILFTMNKVSKEDVISIRLAALLHDLGHGPFSHISEYLLFRFLEDQNEEIEEIHELITTSLIENSNELHKILKSDLINEVTVILNKLDIKKDIVSGPLDADKLDYILRDAYYAGVQYGKFDLIKILESLRPIGTGSSTRLGITEEGVHAVDQLIMAKHHMTIQVYRHRIRSITDAMIIRAIELAIENNDKNLSYLYRYKNDKEYLNNYLAWWDEKIIGYILENGCPKSKDVFNRLFNRHLFKRIHRKRINAKSIPNSELRNKYSTLNDIERKDLENEISKIDELKVDPDYVILSIDSIKNPTYKRPSNEINEDEILVWKNSGNPEILKEIDDSIMKLTDTEYKQEYIEVFTPIKNWHNLSTKKKEAMYKKIDEKVSKILYD
ncbi:MAG: HD domain-containing protein [Candidatus Hodarchaeales archaeon]|jgi:HD superfamily phosphohydrolase